MMKTLTIRLTAPLQSYGNEATFERRTTGDYPSKSAMIGMIAAALGYRRDNVRIKELNDLSFAVRVDQVGQPLTDFQTVEWKRGVRKLTHRDYLQDAVFVAAIGSSDSAQINRIHAALTHPRFQLFLGRRANVPAGVLKVHEFIDTTPVEALRTLKWQASDWYQKRQNQAKTIPLDIIADANLLEQLPNTMVKDQAVSFDQRNRRFGFRAVATTQVTVANPYFQATAHDPIGMLEGRN